MNISSINADFGWAIDKRDSEIVSDQQDIWRAVRDALQATRGTGEPLPDGITQFLYEITSEIAAGKMPETVKIAASGPNAKYDARIVGDICAAVTYVRAVDAGLVEDKSPVKTVRDAYGIHKDTWLRWRRHYYKQPETDPTTKRQDTIKPVMQKSAESYKIFGRGDYNAMKKE